MFLICNMISQLHESRKLYATVVEIVNSTVLVVLIIQLLPYLRNETEAASEVYVVHLQHL